MNRSGCVPATPRVGLAHAAAHQHTDCWLLDQVQLIGRGGYSRQKSVRSGPLRSHEKRCEGLRQAWGWGPPRRAEDVDPQQRFSGLRSRFS
jgi:hypothetical protein